jgi:exopolysaccharide biosynthesis polyprenyl glycosylphosphotransferase
VNARRYRWLPFLITAAADAILIYFGFWFAWWLRYQQDWLLEVTDPFWAPLETYSFVHNAVVPLILVIFWLQGQYRPPRARHWIDEVGRVFAGATVGVAILIVIMFYIRPAALSRLMFIYALIVFTIILALERLLERAIRSYLRRRGVGIEQVLVVGAGDAGRMLMQNIAVQPELGYTVAGFVDDDRCDDLGKFACLGTLRDVGNVVTDRNIDEVIITLPASAHALTSRVMVACTQRNVRCRIVPDFFEISLNQVDVSELNGIPLLSVREYPLHGEMRVIKRLSDMILAALLLAIASPIMALVAIAIKVESPGPVFFRQRRVGRNGHIFTLLKFRSMYEDAEERLALLASQNEASGPLFKMKNDPRLTRVGKIIRRLSIDELPQLINVVQGDMSLVGPRPNLPAEVDAYEDWHRRRLEVRPGLTGLWQVSGRSNLSFEEMVLLDIWYIEYWTPALDFKILLRTVPAVLFGAGAY